jgi:hypothetical protein
MLETTAVRTVVEGGLEEDAIVGGFCGGAAELRLAIGRLRLKLRGGAARGGVVR